MIRLEQVRGEVLERLERLDRRLAQSEQRLARLEQRTGDIVEHVASIRWALGDHRQTVARTPKTRASCGDGDAETPLATGLGAEP